MKPNQLATLVLRLLGVYLLAESIPLIFTSFESAFRVISRGYVLVALWSLLVIGSRIILGILLIVLSEPWGEKLVPKSTNDENISGISFKQAQALAFAVAGVLIFAGALPQLISSIFTLLRSMSSGDSLNYPYGASNSRLVTESSIGTLLKAALGIWLFFGAKGFANFWSSLRNFATPKPPPEQ